MPRVYYFIFIYSQVYSWFEDLKNAFLTPRTWKEKRCPEFIHFIQIAKYHYLPPFPEVSRIILAIFFVLRLEYNAAVQKVYNFAEMENLFERIYHIIKLVPLMTATDLKILLSSGELLHFMADVEPHIKLFSLSDFKKTLLEQLRFSRKEVIAFELSRVRESPLCGVSMFSFTF